MLSNHMMMKFVVVYGFVLVCLVGKSLGFVFGNEVPRDAPDDQSIAQNDLHCFGNDECIISFGRKAAVASRGIYARRSTDGGTTWGNEVEIESIDNGVIARFQRISCSNNLCVVVYVLGSTLKVKFSSNRGQTWQQSSVPSVTQVLGRSCDVSCFEINPQGTIRCLATVLDGSTGQYRILASNNNGASFQAVFAFTPVTTGLTDARLKCLDRQFCVAAFGGTNVGIFQMRTSAGDLTGGSWTNPSKIGNSVGSDADIQANGFTAQLPDLTVIDNSRVLIVAEILTGSNVQFIETSLSLDGGFNYGSFRTVFSTSLSVEVAARPAVACSASVGQCVVTWDAFSTQMSFVQSNNLGQTYGSRQIYQGLPSQAGAFFSFAEVAFTGSRFLSVFQGARFAPNRDEITLLTGDLVVPTNAPTNTPTKNPTKNPTRNPTKNPTKTPTKNPTKEPTFGPTKTPTKKPTFDPTKSPTRNPTLAGQPTKSPTNNPTEELLAPEDDDEDDDNSSALLFVGIGGGALLAFSMIVFFVKKVKDEDKPRREQSMIFPNNKARKKKDSGDPSWVYARNPSFESSGSRTLPSFQVQWAVPVDSSSPYNSGQFSVQSHSSSQFFGPPQHNSRQHNSNQPHNSSSNPMTPPSMNFQRQNPQYRPPTFKSRIPSV